ncbi:MAG: hypothetical protein Q7S46_09135 [Gallionella sp.]|nr:hypothetical protein [Gallionella sp.]
MFGLAVLVVFGVYLLISFLVVRWAIDYARKNGKSAKRWGWGAAFVMYSLVFWDWIPTVAMHQYYCAKDSGFWVYKTLEQWKVENPGVMEGLVEDKITPMHRVSDDENHTDTQILNQRFRWATEKTHPVFLLSVNRLKREIVDSKNGEVVARHIDFGSYSAGWGGLKFWTSIESCSDGISNRNSLYHFVETIVNINKGETK